MRLLRCYLYLCPRRPSHCGKTRISNLFCKLAMSVQSRELSGFFFNFFYFYQVGISIFKILLQITRPRTVVLGNIPGTDIYRNLNHYKDAMSVPGFLILCIEAPINFANSMYLDERFAFLLSKTYATVLYFF